MPESQRSTHVVKAAQPTVLDPQKFYVLNPISFLSFSIDVAIVVPGPIDVSSFGNALGRTLSAFPLYAGRIRRPSAAGGQWQVSLCNHSVPVLVEESKAENIVPIDAIIQTPFMLAKRITPKKYWETNSQEPLLRVTLTHFIKTGNTSIGLSASHAVGDAFVVLAFMHYLSASYQGLDPSAHAISYAAEPTSKASFSRVETFGTPWLDKPYALGTTPALLDPARTQPAVRVDFRLSAAQLTQLRHGVLASRSSEGAVPARLSQQDCLVALICVCISRTDITSPLHRVGMFINHRGIRPTPANAACNALIEVLTGQITSPLSMYEVATSVRASLERCKDPEFVAANVAVCGAKLQAAADAEQAFDYSPDPGHLSVNSTRPFNWTAAHFGYPGRARFYNTDLNAPRYVKIFKPNPTALADGAWRDNRGAAEVTLYLRCEQKPGFERELRAQCHALGLSGEIEVPGKSWDYELMTKSRL